MMSSASPFCKGFLSFFLSVAIGHMSRCVPLYSSNAGEQLEFNATEKFYAT